MAKESSTTQSSRRSSPQPTAPTSVYMQVTTRGRRFTRRVVERLTGITADQSRALKYMEIIEVTPAQACALIEHRFATTVEKPKRKDKEE